MNNIYRKLRRLYIEGDPNKVYQAKLWHQIISKLNGEECKAVIEYSEIIKKIEVERLIGTLKDKRRLLKKKISGTIENLTEEKYRFAYLYHGDIIKELAVLGRKVK